MLSATCTSQFAWLDSCVCHSSRADFSPALSALYGTALQGLLQGMSYVGSTVLKSRLGIEAISVVCRSFHPDGRFTQNLAEYLLPWFHWIHTTLLPYLCSVTLMSSPSTTSGFNSARNASSLAHMIPSESIQLKSGSSHLLALTRSPFASAATTALSAMTTASSAAAAGTHAQVDT